MTNILRCLHQGASIGLTLDMEATDANEVTQLRHIIEAGYRELFGGELQIVKMRRMPDSPQMLCIVMKKIDKTREADS